MPRNLTASQKKVLRDYFKQTGSTFIDSYLIRKLEALNDHETLYSNAQRYINDLKWSR